MLLYSTYKKHAIPSNKIDLVLTLTLVFLFFLHNSNRHNGLDATFHKRNRILVNFEMHGLQMTCYIFQWLQLASFTCQETFCPLVARPGAGTHGPVAVVFARDEADLLRTDLLDFKLETPEPVCK